MSEFGSFTCFSCPGGGTTLADNTLLIPRDHLDREIQQSAGEIRDLGVERKDLRPQNMLWNIEVGRVLIIDFERSSMSSSSSRRKRPSPEVLREVSSNQKRKCLDNDKVGKDQENCMRDS
jgi:predicted Ser/Thr protein kinase